MKRKAVLVSGLVLAILLSFGSGVVLSQTSKELPRLETACETKTGLIHGFDDGFSILKKCSRGSREVSLGKSTGNNFGGGLVNLEEIVFVANDEATTSVYALRSDGTAWFVSKILDENGETNWNHDAIRDLPSNVNINDVVSWNPNVFVTKEGKIYITNYWNDGVGSWREPITLPKK